MFEGVGCAVGGAVLVDISIKNYDYQEDICLFRLF